MSLEDAQRIATNLAGLRERIALAASRCGRDADDVRCVAVTKYVDTPATRAVFDAGCHDLGESRPQQLWNKAEALSDIQPRWHMVGHLQRNKVARTVPLTSLIHSVDSLRLVREIDREAAKINRTVDVLLEVNISGDAVKHGFAPAETEPVLSAMVELSHVKVQGLMTIAHLEGGADVARRNFAALRHVRDRLKNVCPEVVSLAQLSMGMSRDFEAAIAEGATIIRVGSTLFEGIQR